MPHVKLEIPSAATQNTMWTERRVGMKCFAFLQNIATVLALALAYSEVCYATTHRIAQSSSMADDQASERKCQNIAMFSSYVTNFCVMTLEDDTKTAIKVNYLGHSET